jgi:hypothetical protein
VKLKFLILALLLSPVVFAAGTTANLSWTLPTTYTDGSPLAVADLREIIVEWRRTPLGNVIGSVRVPAPATSVNVPGLVCGNYIFVAYVTTVDAQSDASNNAPYATGVKCKPNPVILSVG